MVDTNRRWQAAGFYTQMIIKHTEKQKTANKLEVIIYWSLAAESILTVKFSKNEIRDFFDNPFTMKAYLAITQSFEKLVKEALVALSQVFGAERSDGCLWS